MRRSNINDLDNIYKLHMNCFSKADQWYKPIIAQYLDQGIVIESADKIIGVLLQGCIQACNQEFKNNIDTLYNTNQILESNEEIYKKDIFIPINEDGELFIQNMKHLKKHFGIVLICIDSYYRSKGLAKKLIDKHIKENPDKLLCLHTRKSNFNAYNLYKSMGYTHIGNVENKYFFPKEESSFMIKYT
jgi:ribosomal protein S18 acetylase RimI-like enzyme